MDKKLANLKYKEDSKLNDKFSEANGNEEFFINEDSVPHEVVVSSIKSGGKLYAKLEIDLDSEGGGYDDFYFDYANYMFAGLKIDGFYFTTSDPNKKVSLTIQNVELDSEDNGSVYFADKNIKLKFSNPNHEDWVSDGEVDPWPEDEGYDGDDFGDDEEYDIEPQKPTVRAKKTPMQPEDIPWKYKNVDGVSVGGNGRVSKVLATLKYKENNTLSKKFVDYCSSKGIFKDADGNVLTNYEVEFNNDSVHITFLNDIREDEVYYAGLKYLDALPNNFPHNFYFSTNGKKELVIVVRDNIENGCSYYCDENIKIQFYSKDYYDNKNVSLSEIKKLIQESEKRTERFIMGQVAPGIEDWVINHYSPELERYLVEQFAPEIEHWVVNEFAPEIEKWVTESFAGTLENWVNEELTPEIVGKIKGQVNEQLKNTKEDRLASINETISLLESISPNSPNFRPASSIINEGMENEPIYVQKMPKELRPKYNMASQVVKENLARRARLYDFSVDGAIERFWSSFDSIVESFENQPIQNQPIILDSHEQSIREALRRRFKK